MFAYTLQWVQEPVTLSGNIRCFARPVDVTKQRIRPLWRIAR
nr:hypothetical protein [Kibdelosporangium sp. MJ126-NF4]CTQ91562.1 hypothetical protein [Kibdelosporangium sp. MJ126-NF4]